MRDKFIENAVVRAFESVTPDVFDTVASGCEKREHRTVSFTKRKNSFYKKAVAVAASVMILAGSVAGVSLGKLLNTTVATVTVDVNPSIDIDVNYFDRVVKVAARNEDAQEVLEGTDFKGEKVQVCVENIVKVLAQHEYLSDKSNSVLVSVTSPDEARAVKLQSDIYSNAEAVFKSESFDGSVICQVVDKTAELEAFANANDISMGKAQLVQKLAASEDEAKSLTSLKVNDLNLLIDADVDINGRKVLVSGKASDGKYIGSENALAQTLSTFAVEASQAEGVKVSMGYKEGEMDYNVSLHVADKYISTVVNAGDGRVRSFAIGHQPDGSDAVVTVVDGNNAVTVTSAIDEVIKSISGAVSAADMPDVVLPELVFDEDTDYEEIIERVSLWAHEYGNVWEFWAEDYADAWEAWAEAQGDMWEAWAREYSGNWSQWADDHYDEIMEFIRNWYSDEETAASWIDAITGLIDFIVKVA